MGRRCTQLVTGTIRILWCRFRCRSRIITLTYLQNGLNMTATKIECPNCHRSYQVAQEFLGRKVVCSNKSCGSSFLATELIESVGSDGETDDIPQPPPLQPLPKLDPTEKETLVKPKICTFGILGRLLMYVGALSLLAGSFCPFGSYSPSAGGHVYNIQLATVKQAMLLSGIAMMASGAPLLGRSSSTPKTADVVFVSVFVTIILIKLIWQFGVASLISSDIDFGPPPRKILNDIGK